MKKNWWSVVILAVGLIGLSWLISLVREQAFAQPQAVQQQAVQPMQTAPPATAEPAGPTVVIKQQPEWPRCFVDMTLIDDPTSPGKKVQILTIVDPESKHILVYRADMGKVKLLSVRNFQPDLQFDQYNAEEPTPIEIRKEILRLRGQNQ